MQDSVEELPRPGVGQRGENGWRTAGLHGVAAAAIYVLFELLAPLPFISAGLRMGWRGIAIVAAIASALLFTLGAAIASEIGAVVVLAWVVRLIVAVVIPSLAVVAAIQRGYSLGPALVLAVVVATGGLAFMEGGFRLVAGFSPSAWAASEIETGAEKALETFSASGDERARFTRMWTTLARYLVPSLYVVLSAAMFVASLLVISRTQLAGVGSEGLRFRKLRLPDWLLVAFVAGCLSPVLPEPARLIGYNVLVVVTFLYFLQGLAVFRAISLRLALGRVGTTIIWGGMALMLINGIVPFLMALTGLFDSFFDFRTPKKKGEDDESDTD